MKKNFITRALRRRKMRRLNKTLAKYNNFKLEYVKTIDKYCGCFAYKHVKHGYIMHSLVLWFYGAEKKEGIINVVKSKFDKKEYY